MTEYTLKQHRINLLRLLGAICLLLLSMISVGFFAIRFTGVERLMAMIVGYTALIGACFVNRTTLHDLGLKLSTLVRALKISMGIGLALLVGIGIVFMISPVIFEDERYRLGLVTAIITIGLYLPLRTVIFEELLFRGYIFAEIQKRISQKTAVLVSSAFFGLWHIYPSIGISAVRIPIVGDIPQAIVVAAICVATFFAGLLFCFMRLKTDNLITPILGHWFINAYGIFFAVLAWR